MEKFGIADRHRLKVWMRKYKELGEFGLRDQRGRRKEYIDQDRYVQKLKRENDMLKKTSEGLLGKRIRTPLFDREL